MKPIIREQIRLNIFRQRQEIGLSKGREKLAHYLQPYSCRDSFVRGPVVSYLCQDSPPGSLASAPYFVCPCFSVPFRFGPVRCRSFRFTKIIPCQRSPAPISLRNSCDSPRSRPQNRVDFSFRNLSAAQLSGFVPGWELPHRAINVALTIEFTVEHPIPTAEQTGITIPNYW